MNKIHKKTILTLLFLVVFSFLPLGIAYAAPNTALTITRQPVNSYALSGKRVETTVVAKGTGQLKYQWYFKDVRSSKYSKSSITDDTYFAIMNSNRDGRKIYCVITDATGKSIKTKEVTLRIASELKITSQPKNAFAKSGEKVRATVKATGTGTLNYQWYVLDPGSTSPEKSCMTKDTYTVKMKSSISGRKVYCVITDNYGQKVVSHEVSLSLDAPLEITKQPVDTYALNGKTLQTSVKAVGRGELKYQWYFKDTRSSKFSKSSITGDTYSVAMSNSRNGRKIYCVITDSSGASVKSNTVTLTTPETLKIVTQPKDSLSGPQTIVKTTLKATGTGKLKYQWYVIHPGTKKAEKSSMTTSTYTVKMKEAVAGRKIYCVISDNYGQSVTTNTVTLSMAKPLKIVTQPADATAANGQIAKTSIKATGTGPLTFTWYILHPGKLTSEKSSVTQSTYSVKMRSSVHGRKAYCVVTDNYGQKAISDVCVLSMKESETVKPQPIEKRSILIVGNSHSIDAFWMLYQAYMDQHPYTDLTIGILHWNGASISDHVNFLTNGDPVIRYYKRDSDKFRIKYGVTAESVLTDQPWDTILMQPDKSDLADSTLNKEGRYELNRLIDKYVKTPYKLVWHISWPSPDDEIFFSPDYIRQPPAGYKDKLTNLYGFNSVNQFSVMLNQTKKHILKDSLYDQYVCSGAAIMHARLTQGLTQLDLWRDYTHLSDYGRLMSSYALVAQLSGEPIESVGIDVIPVSWRHKQNKSQGKQILTTKMKNSIIKAANYSLESPWVMPKQIYK